MRRGIAIRLLSFGVFLATIALFVLALKKGLFDVDPSSSHIEVLSSQGLSSGYRDTLVSKIIPILKSLQGARLWEVPLSALVDKVQRETWVLGASVERIFPNRVRIEIRAKPMIWAWISSTGMMTPFADDGSRFPPAEFNQVISESLVLSRDRRIMSDQKTRNKLSEILNRLPEKGDFSRAALAEVEVGRSHQIWLTLSRDLSRIHLGEDNIEIRAARVAQVLKYLDQNKLGGRVIDADFSKKVLVRSRNRH